MKTKKLISISILLITIFTIYYLYYPKQWEYIEHYQPYPVKLESRNYKYKNVSVQGNRIFLSDLANHIFILDSSNLHNIVELSQIILEGNITDIKIYNDFLFVVNSKVGLQIIDVTQPDNPIMVDTYFPTGEDGMFTTDLLISGDTAFLQDQFGKKYLHILDIHDPKNIETIALIQEGGYPLAIHRDLLVTDSAILGWNHKGINLFDISDLENPQLIYYESAYGITTDADFNNGNLILATKTGVYSVDVSNPRNPIMLESHKLYYYNAVIQNGKIFASVILNLRVIDISKNMRIKLRRKMPQVRDIVYYEGYIYIADDTGLYIFEAEE